MRRSSFLGVVAGLALAIAAPAANAATLGVFTHIYGNGTGQTDPGGSDTLGDGYVMVSDQSTRRFSDAFDFSSLDYSSIDSLALTLTFSRSGPSFIPGELWSVRVQGSDSAAFGDDLFAILADVFSPQTVTLNLFTDFLSGNSFAHSLATESLSFWFAESSFGTDSFKLNSASLTVNGTPSAVPLPAGGLMLLGAIAGLAALRRRKSA